MKTAKPKRGFMDGYRTHDGPRGNAAQWTTAFRARMGAAEVAEALGNDDPRAVLGVGPGATWAEIKSAYRRLALQHHPDRPGGDAAMFRKIQAAYEVLEDQQT